MGCFGDQTPWDCSLGTYKRRLQRLCTRISYLTTSCELNTGSSNIFQNVKKVFRISSHQKILTYLGCFNMSCLKIIAFGDVAACDNNRNMVATMTRTSNSVASKRRLGSSKRTLPWYSSLILQRSATAKNNYYFLRVIPNIF